MNAVQPTAPVASAARRFAGVFASAATAENMAPGLTCMELDALLELFGTVGALDAATEWIAAHTESECEGHTIPEACTPEPEAPTYDAHGNYTPEPGTEYPFSVSDIARATAKLLGQGWTAESGYWGVTGALSGPYTADFEFVVDYQGDLTLTYTPYVGDGFPDVPELPDGVKECGEGVYLELASAADGLDSLAERSAAAIRAVTGYDPANFDFESSASRQHHVDTGRYLRAGEAEQV